MVSSALQTPIDQKVRCRAVAKRRVGSGQQQRQVLKLHKSSPCLFDLEANLPPNNFKQMPRKSQTVSIRLPSLGLTK